MYKTNYFRKKEEKLNRLAEKVVNKAFKHECGADQYINLMQRYRFVCFMFRTRKERGMYDQRKLP